MATSSTSSSSTSSSSATFSTDSSSLTSLATTDSCPFGHSLPTIGIKLDNKNYLPWKTRFKPFLRAYCMLDLVEGRSACPPLTLPTSNQSDSPSPNPAYAAWTQRDQLALGWILSTVDDFVTTHLIGCETSQAAWTALERFFSQQNQARVMQLRTEFSLLKKGSLPMSEYLTKAKMIADSLASIDRPLSSDEILSRVLQGLGPDYAGFRTTLSLNLNNTEHTLESLHAPLLRQEALLSLDEPSGPDLLAASLMAHLSTLSAPTAP